MQAEVLQFLLETSVQPQCAAGDDTGDRHLDDMQAVDRFLPDCDWFEIDGQPDAAQFESTGLSAGQRLQFDV